MLPKCIIEIYKYVDSSKCIILDAGATDILIENKKEGKAELTIDVTDDTIIVKKPEKNIFPYIGDGKGYKRCCDNFMFTFEKEGSNDCLLHILEFKKTVNVNIICNDIIPQFKMGILNAKAIAGFLNINITNLNSIKSYVAYRTFNNPPISIAMRAANNSLTAKCVQAWENNKLPLEMPWGTIECNNTKVTLDDEGYGRLTI